MKYYIDIVIKIKYYIDIVTKNKYYIDIVIEMKYYIDIVFAPCYSLGQSSSNRQLLCIDRALIVLLPGVNWLQLSPNCLSFPRLSTQVLITGLFVVRAL